MDHKINNEKNIQDGNLNHLDIEMTDAASTTDLTGLIPANPEKDDIDTYKTIRDFGNDVKK